MKNFILPLCFALVFSACSDKKENAEEVTRQIVLTDSANLNASNINTDIAAEEAVAEPAPAPKVVYVDRYVKPAPAPRVRTVTPKAAPVQEQPQTNNNTSTAPEAGNTAPTSTDVVTAEPEVKKKTGVSDAAKGAVIGGVGGAAAGAVISRSGKGAVIGGVIGAAGGYILGRKKDKQSGRIE
jgi:hypothetical protein